MKKITYFIALILSVTLCCGCVEKSGYYTEGENEIISLICDVTWTGGEKTYEDGSSWESVWDFDKDGTYIRTNIETDKEGNVNRGKICGRWSFYTPNFSVLYFGGSNYWDIKDLNQNVFSFYDRTGELDDPSMTKEYVEFHPYKSGDI